MKQQCAICNQPLQGGWCFDKTSAERICFSCKVEQLGADCKHYHQRALQAENPMMSETEINTLMEKELLEQ